ncbi:uncharacterized protein LOC107273483 isoform X2 [Cephus cinctus]|uniref:Uncharacterized protein LOC107273483 isoform X2 n=1 Tax=Cephus cinctus TaxID=211228 RepID=A0AAJ7RT10_CEPCN|nr:uncharacterized protein LOC107273483 isoform X2 [Cephus cinctus]
MEYDETLGNPAKRRKLSGGYRSYSRLSVNKQTKSELPMQKISLLQCSNKKDIKNNKRVEFDTFIPLRQGSSTNMFEDNILLPRKPIQSHLPIIKEKKGIQHSSSKTKIDTENFLPIINDSQEKGTSLPHNKDKNAFENKNATDTLTSSEEEASFWTSMGKSVSNKAKLYSDKNDASTEERILSRNVEVLSDTVKKTNIFITSNKTDDIIIPKISLKENKLNRKIKPFHKSKIPKLLSKNFMNQKKCSLAKNLMIRDHNHNIPINSVAEKRAVENLSKTDIPVSNFGIAAAKAQKNAQVEVQSKSNVSKVSQKTKINVPNKPSTNKVRFMDPLVTSNGSKAHMTREIKLLLDQNKSFGSDFISDLVVEPEINRRTSLRMRESNESPQIYNLKSTKEEKNVKPKKHKHKQNKFLNTATAQNSKTISLKRKMRNNIQTTPTSKSTKLRNNQNNNSTEHVMQPITNVTINKPNMSMERKSKYTKSTANIAVIKSQEGNDFSAEDENIVESQLVPNEKTIEKDRYTKQSKSQTDQLLSEKSETNANGNNVQNIEESNSLTQIKHIGTAVSLESNYTKEAGRNVLKESNIEKAIIKMKPRGQSWSPGLKHVILDSGDNTPAIGVRMMVDIPYNGKSVQLECLADYALICSNYKPIPGTEGNVVYGNGLHTAMNDICSGNIEMNPNSSKGTQTPKRHHLIFCVIKGTVIFTIRHAKKKISTGAHFFVPCGISYNIENIGTEKAVLSFFKITRGCIALDRSA